jgi:hypothetical protein
MEAPERCRCAQRDRDVFRKHRKLGQATTIVSAEKFEAAFQDGIDGAVSWLASSPCQAARTFSIEGFQQPFGGTIGRITLINTLAHHGAGEFEGYRPLTQAL